ncbi:MAG: CBS domain-containing protein [Myxococcaceae bacterium]
MPLPRQVRDVMVRSPRTVAPDVGVLAPFEQMLEGGFRHVPVVDGERLVGMLSDRDIMKHMPPPSLQPADLPAHARFAHMKVSEIMAQPALSVLETDSLDVAVELMLVNQISAVVVTDANERLVGIVTLVDVARVLLKVLHSLA